MSRRCFGALALLVGLAAAFLDATAAGATTAAGAPRAGAFEPVFQKGITFVHGYRDHSDLESPAARASLQYLAERVNVEWIALNPFAYQNAVDAPELRFGGDPRDAQLVHAIRQAHQLDLKIMLKPHIWLRHQSETAWRGTIAMADSADWRRWFDAYQRFIVHYARIAAAEDVEIFCVGVELARTVRERPDDWRRIIDAVRQVYDGPLTYAANWHGEFDQIDLWTHLDYIGINAFFPLSDTADPSLEALRAGAEQVADRIELVHQASGRPVVFTEVGYKSMPGSTVRPWEWPRRQQSDIDLELQARAYQAILETMWRRPWFYGFYWWKWFSSLERGGPGHAGFTPRGKPAEDLLSKWYRRPPPGRAID